MDLVDVIVVVRSAAPVLIVVCLLGAVFVGLPRAWRRRSHLLREEKRLRRVLAEQVHLAQPSSSNR